MAKLVKKPTKSKRKKSKIGTRIIGGVKFRWARRVGPKKSAKQYAKQHKDRRHRVVKDSKGDYHVYFGPKK